MKTKEETFVEVLSAQQKYHWLGHDQIRTPEEMEQISMNINRKIFGLPPKINKRFKDLGGVLVMAALMIMLTFSSCKKQWGADTDPTPINPDDKIELVTQEFGLTTLTTKDILTKGFDPSLWVYQYSDVKYELKVSNSMNTYTRQVSVNEMLAGSVSFQLVPGLYSVTYSPLHSPKFDTKLDVKIAMTNVTIDGTPIILQGQLDDALIVIDIPGLRNVYSPYPTKVFTHDARGFEFAYVNGPFDLNIQVTDTDGQPLDKFLSMNPTMGVCYWIQSNIGVQVELQIPAMTVEPYILP